MEEYRSEQSGLSSKEWELDYKELFENYIDAISIFDKTGRHVWCNDTALEMYGYSSRDEVIGLMVDEFIPLDERAFIWHQHSLAISGDADQFDFHRLNVRKDGSTFVVHSRTSVITSEGEVVGFQVHSRDVTHLMMTANQYKESMAELELLISLIRHDFGNDLQVITGAIGTALVVMEDGPITKDYLTIAQNGVDRMSSLLTLLSSEYPLHNLSLLDLIHDRAQHALRIHPGLMIIITDAEIVRNVTLDLGRLLPSLFDNLFRNTAKHAGPNASVSVYFEHQNGILEIDIVDDGPGIREDIRDTIFERDSSSSSGGMGLYICRKIVEVYGGTMELLDLAPTAPGTAFRITFPLKNHSITSR